MIDTSPRVIPAPSSKRLLVTVEPMPMLKSPSSIVVELIKVSVPSTYKSPLIRTIPVLTPIAAGSIISSGGPVMVLEVMLIASPVSPVENLIAVIIPTSICVLSILAITAFVASRFVIVA